MSADPKKMTESADPKYLHGTQDELAGRLEKGYGPTESHFTQVRPEVSSPRGKSVNDDHGRDVRRSGHAVR